jgi:hypothetical protein
MNSDSLDFAPDPADPDDNDFQVADGANLRWVTTMLREQAKEDTLIIDPFCGSGTTGRAAQILGMAFRMSDSDPFRVIGAASKCARHHARSQKVRRSIDILAGCLDATGESRWTLSETRLADHRVELRSDLASSTVAAHLMTKAIANGARNVERIVDDPLTQPRPHVKAGNTIANTTFWLDCGEIARVVGPDDPQSVLVFASPPHPVSRRQPSGAQERLASVTSEVLIRSGVVLPTILPPISSIDPRPMLEPPPLSSTTHPQGGLAKYFETLRRLIVGCASMIQGGRSVKLILEYEYGINNLGPPTWSIVVDLAAAHGMQNTTIVERYSGSSPDGFAENVTGGLIIIDGNGSERDRV